MEKGVVSFLDPEADVTRKSGIALKLKIVKVLKY